MEAGHSYCIYPTIKILAKLSRQKNQTIFSKEEWFDLVRNTQTMNSFKVIEMKEHFQNLKELLNNRKFSAKNTDGNKFHSFTVRYFGVTRRTPVLRFQLPTDESGVFRRVILTL